MNKTAQRALLVRPLALCLGVLGMVWLNPVLREGWLFTAIATFFALPNFLLWVASDQRFVARFAPIVSPAISLIGWGVLALFTQGLKSPVLAAFFFEVGLAAISAGPLGVAAVTALGALVLLFIQALFGLAEGWPLWLLEAGFLAVMGGLGFAVARRRLASETALRVQSDELGKRLESLKRELEDERVVARVGENVARLAHGLKNAVHSLRGFVGLIEVEGSSSREALAGLRAAIDDLERLARLTLADGGASGTAPAGPVPVPRAPATPGVGSGSTTARRDLAVTVERVVEAVQSANPDVEFTLRSAPDALGRRVPIPDASLAELLTILLRNAVEAMGGGGHCAIDVAGRGNTCRIEIADEGGGVAPEIEERLFTPGFTTKAGGSGFGLFLARRILEDHGGRLSLVSGPEKGAIAVVEVPFLAEARSGGDA